MRFAFLGSGSRGNAALIESGDTCVMLDCGFSARETTTRLRMLDYEGSRISAILVTHEHGDHINGVGVVARQHSLPIWMTAGTYRATRERLGKLPELHIICPHKMFSVGEIDVQPFPVPHDALEPSQFVFSAQGRRLGILTDTGSITTHIKDQLDGCDSLVIECNHDRDMLMQGVYPPSLKARVDGEYGHLNNEMAAALLAQLDTGNLQHMVTAHLSEKNNTPYLAQTALSDVLGCEHNNIKVAEQERGLPWCDIA